MAKRKPQTQPKAKTGNKREVGYKKPPVEHQFQPGNQAAKGHGRPKNLSQLRELIQELGNEQMTADGWTRLQVMLRGMYASKNASDKHTVLEYGFGKVPQPIQAAIDAELAALLREMTPEERQAWLELWRKQGAGSLAEQWMASAGIEVAG